MRYLPLTADDRAAMLDVIGAGSVDELFADVPASARLSQPIDLPAHQGEWEVEKAFRALAGRSLSPNEVPSFLGAGAYRHHIPASVDHLIQRSEFLTSYTPYQPEIAQGTLQHLFEFQSQVALLTGMDVANASMYDGATSCAEAVLMAKRQTRRSRAILSGALHPHYRDCTRTMAGFVDHGVETLPLDLDGSEDLTTHLAKDVACVVVQYPDVLGRVRDLTALAEAVHEAGALLIVAVTEIVSLGALVPPGAMGADIVVAEGQSLGVPLSFGGPYVGLFATREKFLRQMPGRLCGETVDADGRRGYVLTLSAREQHIRREKATSNICTNAGLCALAFSIHLSLLGEAGYVRLAQINHGKAVQAADKLAAIPGVTLVNQGFFNEFTLKLPKDATEVVEALARKRILAGVPGARLWPEDPQAANLLLVAVTELNDDGDVDALVAALAAEVK